MNTPPRREWVRAALLAGLGYFIIGRVFTLPASHVQLWRLAAWLVSGGIYAAHIAYEHFRLRSSTRRTALHVAVGVALGAIALAVAAAIHSLSTAAGFRPVWLVALVAWPAITAIPAFVVALVGAAVLARLSRRGNAP